MAITALPMSIVMNVPKAATNTYLYRKDDGSVVDGEDSMFSPLVKIRVQQAAVNTKYVHLLFCYNNRYWQKSSDNNTIVAVSTKPEEDTSKPSCTLFEPTLKADTLYFTHVQTGWGVMMNNSTKGFYVDPNSVGAPLGFVDWDTLVKLPEHLAFKGDNGKYLKAFHTEGYNFFQFGSDDPNDGLCGLVVSLMNDGHVRVNSDFWGMFWRRSPNWIFADSTDVTANNKDTLFWPVKIDGTTIGLRNDGNNCFCKRLSTEGKINCLNASAENLTTEARLQVQELVMNRKIHNVVYRLEDARIYGETPYVAGTSVVTNNVDQVASHTVKISYESSLTYSFQNSVSITAGIKNTISAGVPEIVKDSVEISFYINTSMEWGESKTKTTTVTATESISVPPMSVSTVSYVGTMGTYDIPFSYTQRDTKSTDGSITHTNQIDGVYTGVNAYNFHFKIEKSESLV